MYVLDVHDVKSLQQFLQRSAVEVLHVCRIFSSLTGVIESLDILASRSELTTFFDGVLESATRTKIYEIVDKLQLRFGFQELFDGPSDSPNSANQWANFSRSLVDVFGYPGADVASLANASITLQPVSQMSIHFLKPLFEGGGSQKIRI